MSTLQVQAHNCFIVLLFESECYYVEYIDFLNTALLILLPINIPAQCVT